MAEEPGPTAAVAFDEPARGRMLHAELDVEAAASDGRVLVVGGGERLDGDTVGLFDDVIVVDVASGEQTVVALPASDPPVALVDVASDGAGGFVVAGLRCVEAARMPLGEEDACQPGTPVALAFDPVGSEWEELPFPEQVSPAAPEVAWWSSTELSTIPGGGVVAVVTAGPSRTAGGGGPSTNALVLDDGAWTALGATDGGQTCATRDALVELSVSEADPRLWRSPLAGGERAEIAVPDAVHGEVGGVGTFLGCTEDAVFVTSPDRLPDAEGAALLRWDGREWSSQSVGGPGTLPRTLTSTAAGLHLGVRAGDAGFGAYLIGPDATVVEDPSLELDEVLLDPVTDQAIAIGPHPGLARSLQPDDPPEDLPAPEIRQVPLPGA